MDALKDRNRETMEGFIRAALCLTLVGRRQQRGEG